MTEVDGLILKINQDFLTTIENRGLSPSKIKIKYLSRDSKIKTTYTKYFSSLESYNNEYAYIFNSDCYKCYGDKFPVIENLVLTNNNLNFKNSFAWYNITDKRFFVKTLAYDNQRKDIYEAEIQRYITLSYELFDKYTKDINKGIAERLNSYVDPCYTVPGYVDPNSECDVNVPIPAQPIQTDPFYIRA